MTSPRSVAQSPAAFRHPRWYAVATAGLLVVATGAGPASAIVAPPKPVPCPAGQVRIAIAGKSSCVLTGRALPAPPPAQTAGSFVIGAGLGGLLARAESKAFPPSQKELAVGSAFATGGAALAPGIETLAKLARGTAARPRIGAPVLTMQRAMMLAGGWSVPERSSSSSATATTTVASSSLAANGTVGTVTATGVVPKQRDGSPDNSRATLEFAVKIDTPSNGTASIAVTQSLGDKVTTTGPCSDSAGRIDLSTKSTTSLRTSQEGTSVGLDYIRKNTTATTNATFIATVAPDAYLQSTSFTVGVTGQVAYSASGFNGLVRQVHNVTITAQGTGTINGRTGAVSVTSLQVDGGGTSLGMTNAAAQSAIRNALQGDQVYAELVARVAADGQERLKEAEKIWREPNKCVDMRFAPASGAKLGAGATLAVDGKIVAKRDGKPTTAVWRAPRITRGSLVGPWPGQSLPTKPLRFTAKGAAPTPAGITFALTTTALSRAGIASGPWEGTSGGWRVTITGPITGDQGQGIGLASTIKAVVDVRLVTRNGVPTYYASQPVTYTPPVVTQPTMGACVPPPGGSFPVPGTYTFIGVEGTADVEIVPETTGTAPKIKVTLTLADRASGTFTCPGGAASPLESLFLGLNAVDSPMGRSITVPAAAISTTAVSWSTAVPLPATGALTVRVEPI